MSRRIEHGVHLAEYAKKVLNGLSNWEIVSEPSLAVINFRYIDEGLSKNEIYKLNNEISQKALKENFAGVFTTVLNEKVVLRICCINHETTELDIERTINMLDGFAKDILKKAYN